MGQWHARIFYRPLTTYLCSAVFLAFASASPQAFSSFRAELEQLKSQEDQVQINLPAEVHQRREWFLPPRQITQGSPSAQDIDSETDLSDEVSLSMAAIERDNSSGNENMGTQQRAQQLLDELEGPKRSGSYRSLWASPGQGPTSKGSNQRFRARSR